MNRLRVQQIVIFAGTAAVLISDQRRVHRIGSLVVTLAFATGLLIRFLPGVLVTVANRSSIAPANSGSKRADLDPPVNGLAEAAMGRRCRRELVSSPSPVACRRGYHGMVG